MAAYESDLDRSFRRTRVLMTGVLFTPEGAHKVRIRDLSRSGAQVVADAPISSGCDAIFKRGTVFAAGHVVWSTNSQTGLEFYRQLSDAELESAFNPVIPMAAR